ncbi:MAG TPA: hypothetical protein PLC89_18165 [Haliscomenobacter sp.]|uniref:tectonin domain-containing protein n=1 Tax=Haliscomenobacter sp. TaxID=2717303 RepID=UPI002CCA20F6|nr:tectonin domain-containing protein [Haliscomenobacter sp.]HOY19239.1 hypothetical protein [Haliscomenobacter sp.]
MKYFLFFLLLMSSLASYADQWRLQPGQARDIAVGADGSVWSIGNVAPHGGGYTIQRWTGSAWQAVDGAALRVAVDPQGNPWVVNDANQIFRRESNRWIQVPGQARDIGIGADGSVWIIGAEVAAGGYSIRYWSGSAWVLVGGGGVRISVHPSGQPFVVNNRGEIFQRNVSGSWRNYPGLATDIAVGPSGALWVIGTDVIGSDFGIHFWNGLEWNTVDGGGTQIGVGTDGRPWIANSRFEIYRRMYTLNTLSRSPSVAPVSMNYSVGPTTFAGRISAICSRPGAPDHVVVAGESGGVFECTNFLSDSRRWNHLRMLRQHNVTDVILIPVTRSGATYTQLWASSMNTYDALTKPQIWLRQSDGNWTQAAFVSDTRSLRPEETDTYRIIKSKVNDDLYAVGKYGIAHKPSNGDQWRLVSTNLHGWISLESLSDGTLIAAGAQGIHFSSDGGRIWSTPFDQTTWYGSASRPQWLSPEDRFCLKADPGGLVVMACKKVEGEKRMQLYGSVNSGRNWAAFRTICGKGTNNAAGGWISITPEYNSVSRQLEVYVSNTENVHYGYLPGNTPQEALSTAMANPAFSWLPGSSYNGGFGFNWYHADTRQIVLLNTGSGRRRMLISSDGGLYSANLTRPDIQSLISDVRSEGPTQGLNALQVYNLTGDGREFTFGTQDNAFGYHGSGDLTNWFIGGGTEGFTINRRGAWVYEYSDYQLIGLGGIWGRVGLNFGAARECVSPTGPNESTFNAPTVGYGAPITLANHVYIQNQRPVAGSTTFPWQISKNDGCNWQNLPNTPLERSQGELAFFSTAPNGRLVLTTTLKDPTRGIVPARLENPINLLPGTNWQIPTMTGMRGGIALMGSQFLYNPVVAVNSANPLHLIAAEESSGFLKSSRDGGNSWTEVSGFNSLYRSMNGMPKSSGGNHSIWSISFSPFDPDVVIVGTVSKGLFLSLDGGNSWGALSNPGIFMPTSFFWKSPTEVIVSTYGRGLFTIRF